jgi:hypothetical protein
MKKQANFYLTTKKKSGRVIAAYPVEEGDDIKVKKGCVSGRGFSRVAESRGQTRDRPTER